LVLAVAMLIVVATSVFARSVDHNRSETTLNFATLGAR
jgi:hypothetical protein